MPRYNSGMNDLPSLPDAGASATSVLPASQVDGNVALDHGQSQARLQKSVRRLAIALGVLALLLIAVWIGDRIAARDLRDETARHLRQGDVGLAEARTLVRTLNDSTRELQNKVTVLESKQIESQSQQLALEQLYQDLAKNGDDWALAEIEQVLSTASQQLQLAGNVQGALIALQNADGRLARSDKPQFILIRRAIGHDIDRLKALPILDLTGIALRLDSIIGQIDGMPLLSDEKPPVPGVLPKKSFATSSGSADWMVAIGNRWQSWTNEMWGEVRQLIRVRTVETSDALLLSPSQAYYARENLKLRLLNARLALLSRNESAFRSDMIASQEAIIKYFDTRARQTQTAQALLRQVQSSNLAIELPTLAESLNAVRNYKVKP